MACQSNKTMHFVIGDLNQTSIQKKVQARVFVLNIYPDPKILIFV